MSRRAAERPVRCLTVPNSGDCPELSPRLAKAPAMLRPSILTQLPLAALATQFVLCAAAADVSSLERIVVAPEGRGFVQSPSGRAFIPWGFNYDHDRDGRLIEDYWDDEWDTLAADFREMRALGAHVVRVHLQFGKFMQSADEPRPAALERLGQLVRLAEEVGLHLDLTGLGCYHKADVPDWYDALDEAGRWTAQANFWRAIARQCAGSRAIFCYDLMNEPVAPAGSAARDWLGPAFAGKHFVQRISLDLAGRERAEVARQWIHLLVAAIREHDRETLVTVGLVPWSLNRPGLTSGFDPTLVAGELDFIAVHLYPESGKPAEALDTLRGFDVGKPIIIEETFPLKCSPQELGEFIAASRGLAHGWIGFYWGQTAEEYAAQQTIPAAIVGQWLEWFAAHPPQP